MTYSSEWPCLFCVFPALSVALCVFSLMSVSRAVKHTEVNHGVNPTASSSSPSRWSSFTHSFHRSLSHSPYRDLKTVCLLFRWPSSSFGNPLRIAREKEWLDLNAVKEIEIDWSTQKCREEWTIVTEIVLDCVSWMCFIAAGSKCHSEEGVALHKTLFPVPSATTPFPKSIP